MNELPVPAAPEAPSPPRNVHASVVVFGDTGVLIRGRSRSGKSALALSVLRRAELLGVEAALVADDQIFLERVGDGLIAVAPEAIRGLIEVSGIGILRERSVDRATVTLVVDLEEPDAIARMPLSETTELLGLSLKRIVLPARQASFGADVLQGMVRAARLSSDPR